MIEARSFVKNFNQAKKVLEEQKAVYKGEYKIHDKIFKNKNKPLSEEFLRLRFVLKNIWNEKEVVVVIKNTYVKEFGKNSVTPLKKQFNTNEEAQKFIEENLLNDFEYSFEFGRTGWQYDLGNGEQVDLEDIEGNLSIEIKSETEEGIKNLIYLFGMDEIIKGSSVVKVKELLGV